MIMNLMETSQALHFTSCDVLCCYRNVFVFCNDVMKYAIIAVIVEEAKKFNFQWVLKLPSPTHHHHHNNWFRFRFRFFFSMTISWCVSKELDFMTHLTINHIWDLSFFFKSECKKKKIFILFHWKFEMRSVRSRMSNLHHISRSPNLHVLQSKFKSSFSPPDNHFFTPLVGSILIVV